MAHARQRPSILCIGFRRQVTPCSDTKYFRVIEGSWHWVQYCATYLGLPVSALHTCYSNGLSSLPPVWSRAPLSWFV